jgi:hypothetical protein
MYRYTLAVLSFTVPLDDKSPLGMLTDRGDVRRVGQCLRIAVCLGCTTSYRCFDANRGWYSTCRMDQSPLPTPKGSAVILKPQTQDRALTDILSGPLQENLIFAYLSNVSDHIDAHTILATYV